MPPTTKKPAFGRTRVWSKADEIRILRGLAAYAAAHGGGEPPQSKLKDALAGCGLDKAEFTVTQIYEKVRALRNKYRSMLAKGPPAASGDNEDLCLRYELSRAIWGDQPEPRAATRATKSAAAGGGAASAAKTAAAAAAAVGNAARRDFEELRGLFPNLAVAVEGIAEGTKDHRVGPMFKRAFQLITDQQAAQLDAKVKKQRFLEVQMEIKHKALRNEVLSQLLASID